LHVAAHRGGVVEPCGRASVGEGVRAGPVLRRGVEGDRQGGDPRCARASCHAPAAQPLAHLTGPRRPTYDASLARGLHAHFAPCEHPESPQSPNAAHPPPPGPRRGPCVRPSIRRRVATIHTRALPRAPGRTGDGNLAAPPHGVLRGHGPCEMLPVRRPSAPQLAALHDHHNKSTRRVLPVPSSTPWVLACCARSTPPPQRSLQPLQQLRERVRQTQRAHVGLHRMPYIHSSMAQPSGMAGVPEAVAFTVGRISCQWEAPQGIVMLLSTGIR
jgi:hypothetical protein